MRGGVRGGGGRLGCFIESLSPLHPSLPLLPCQAASLAQGSAAPLPALQQRTPFSESAVWEGSLGYVRRALGIPHIAVLRVEDAGVLEAADPAARARDVVPGEPSVHAYAEAAPTPA